MLDIQPYFANVSGVEAFVAPSSPNHVTHRSALMAANLIFYKNEEWKTIPSNPNHQASDLGRIRKEYIDRFEIVSGNLGNKGYIQVTVNKKRYQAHRLVAEAFGLDTSMFIDHINSVRSDNALHNLRSCSHHENICFAYKKSPLLRCVYFHNSRKFWFVKFCKTNTQPSYYKGMFKTSKEAKLHADKVRKRRKSKSKAYR